MSARNTIADIDRLFGNVRFVPEADMLTTDPALSR